MTKKTKATAKRKATTHKAKPSTARAATTPTAPTKQQPGPATKKDTVLALLKREEGATLDQLMSATGWQAHSVRGFISGTLRKKLVIVVQRFTREDGSSAYHVASA